MIIVHRFVVILNFYRFSRLKNVRMYRAYCELEKRYFLLFLQNHILNPPRPGLFVEDQERTMSFILISSLVFFLDGLTKLLFCGCFDFSSDLVALLNPIVTILVCFSNVRFVQNFSRSSLNFLSTAHRSMSGFSTTNRPTLLSK